jgi:hypothetical protein
MFLHSADSYLSNYSVIFQRTAIFIFTAVTISNIVQHKNIFTMSKSIDVDDNQKSYMYTTLTEPINIEIKQFSVYGVPYKYTQ